ncbi:MAG: hypothetical protein BroJett001_16730 [Chloroflexota bacterium]|nr:MAG: hypothetical protein BroJett001_16730 [Chloroflexota bacterium]
MFSQVLSQSARHHKNASTKKQHPKHKEKQQKFVQRLPALANEKPEKQPSTEKSKPSHSPGGKYEIDDQ